VKRPRFIAILGSAVAVWPVIVRAEELTSKLPRIGFIQNFRNENFEALTKGLREAGYIDGQNVDGKALSRSCTRASAIWVRTTNIRPNAPNSCNSEDVVLALQCTMIDPASSTMAGTNATNASK
jgi:hypothetical protein